MAGKLVIGPEGFVDLRKNPPATTVTVQGFTPEPEGPRKLTVTETLPEPPAEKREEVLPGRQKTTEGLETSVAEPVKVVRTKKPYVLKRIQSVDDPKCYAIVGASQYGRLGRYEWHATRTGKMYRKVTSASGVVTISWLHREAAKCYRNDRFVAFLDGSEKNCHFTNLKVVSSREEAKAIRLQALSAVSGSLVQKTQPQQASPRSIER